MKLNLILISSTVLLLGLPSFAADSAPGAASTGDADDTGIKSYHPVEKKSKGASPSSKMVIPPPPKETTPYNTPGNFGAIPTVPAAPKTTDNSLTTVGSAVCTSANNRVQQFSNYLDIKQGMDSAPLTMHLTNNGFSWFRLKIANRVMATEKNLGGKPEGDVDLTGAVDAGTNQILVEAGGPPGSRLEWKVTTPAVCKIDRVDPDEVVIGDEFKIRGKNFSTNAGKDEVSLNKSKAPVSRARSSELVVKVPDNAEPGDNKVSVKVNGVKSNEVKIKVRGIPELTGSNLQGARPGDTLMIFGKNFSKNVSENQVYFGDTPGIVTAGSETQLNVTVPFIQQREGHFASNMRVQVGKIMSKNTFPVQIGPQMYSDPGLSVGPDTPTFTPQNLPRSGY